MLVYQHQQPFRGLQINRTHPLARKLIGYWPFNDGTGKKTWDYSGNANRGTLEGGATWAPGRRGWAVNCDGVDGRIDCGNGAPLDDLGNGSFWLSFRMKSKDTVPLAYGGLFGKSSIDLMDRIGIFSQFTSNAIGIQIDKGAVNLVTYFTNTNPFDTIWNHIVVVVNRITDKCLCYMNTIKDPIEMDLATLPDDCSNTGAVVWGSRYSSGSVFFEGALGNLQIHTGVPTQELINWLYREPYAIFVPWRRRYYSIPKTIKRAYIRFQPAGAEIVVQATGAIILFE